MPGMAGKRERHNLSIKLQDIVPEDKLITIPIQFSENELIRIFRAKNFKEKNKLPDQTADSLEDRIFAFAPEHIKFRILKKLFKKPQNFFHKRRIMMPNIPDIPTPEICMGLKAIADTTISDEADKITGICIQAINRLKDLENDVADLKEILKNARFWASYALGSEESPVLSLKTKAQQGDFSAITKHFDPTSDLFVSWSRIRETHTALMDAAADPDTAFLTWKPEIKQLINILKESENK